MRLTFPRINRCTVIYEKNTLMEDKNIYIYIYTYIRFKIYYRIGKGFENNKDSKFVQIQLCNKPIHYYFP